MNRNIIPIGNQIDVEPIDSTVEDMYDVITRSAEEFCIFRNSQLIDAEALLYFEGKEIGHDIIDDVATDKSLSILDEYMPIIEVATNVTKDTPNYIVNGKMLLKVVLQTKGSNPVDVPIFIWVNDAINIIGIDAQTFAKCIKNGLSRIRHRSNTKINAVNVDSKGIMTDKDMSGYYYQ